MSYIYGGLISLPPLDDEMKSLIENFISSLPDESDFEHIYLYINQYAQEERRKRFSFCICCETNIDVLKSVPYFDAISIRAQLLNGLLNDWHQNYFVDFVCDDHIEVLGVHQLIHEQAQRIEADRERARIKGLLFGTIESESFRKYVSSKGKRGELNINEALKYLNKGHEMGVFSKMNETHYSNFLSSDYWFLVSRIARAEAENKCQSCGSTKNICVHHKTYEHRGFEHNHFDDLMVLCNSCHNKEHARIRGGV